MATTWTWLAVAAAGALHGLNPATGWALAAWRARGPATLARALAPIALGHAAAVLAVAAAVPLALRQGWTFEPWLLQAVAGFALLAALAMHGRGAHHRGCTPAGAVGVASWAFLMGTVHGAGWMLVPVLVPLCAGDLPGREITAAGSAWLSLAAVGVHLGAMLATTAAVAAVARVGARRLRGAAPVVFIDTFLQHAARLCPRLGSRESIRARPSVSPASKPMTPADGCRGTSSSRVRRPSPAVAAARLNLVMAWRNLQEANQAMEEFECQRNAALGAVAPRADGASPPPEG